MGLGGARPVRSLSNEHPLENPEMPFHSSDGGETTIGSLVETTVLNVGAIYRIAAVFVKRGYQLDQHRCGCNRTEDC
jgi:hypothetical protein